MERTNYSSIETKTLNLKMKIFLALIFNIIFINQFFSQSGKEVKNYNDFIDKDWKIISKTEGDLNNDGEKDIALVIENTDKNNFVKNENLGSDTLNLNPRRIIVALKSKDSYLLKVDNVHFIPSSGDVEATCLADPFEDGLIIEKGVLKIDLNYWYSCGSWYTNHNTYIFRYQNNQFEMIGYESSEFHRASGEATSISINYSTKKKIETTGLNEFNESKPKSKVSKIKVNKLYNLNEIVMDYSFPNE